MADMNVGDMGAAYRNLGSTNLLDMATKATQLQSYNLDMAGKAREYYGLMNYGKGAAAGEQSAIEGLAASAPGLAKEVVGMHQIKAATDQQRQQTQSQLMGQAGLALSQIADPALRDQVAQQYATRAQQLGVPRAWTDAMLSNYARDPNATIRYLQQQAMPAHATPGAHAEGQVLTAQGTAPIQLEVDKAKETWKAPTPFRTLNPATGEYETKAAPGPQLPGAVTTLPPFTSPNFIGAPGAVGIPAPSGAPPSSAPRPPASRPAAPAAPAGDDGGEGSSVSPETYMNQLFGQESGRDPNVSNRMGSGALGLGQFMPETWMDQARKRFPDQIQGMDKAQVLALRRNPDLQKAATMGLAQDNADFLAERGLPVTAATLAMSHKLGAGGAAAVLQANPNTPMTAVLDRIHPSASRQNPGWARMNAGSFVSSHQDAYSNRPIEGITGGTAPAPRAVAATTGDFPGARAPMVAAAPAQGATGQSAYDRFVAANVPGGTTAAAAVAPAAAPPGAMTAPVATTAPSAPIAAPPAATTAPAPTTAAPEPTAPPSAAPARAARAWQYPDTIVGDSIAQQANNHAKVGGDFKVGRNPSEVLTVLEERGQEAFAGKNVLLSTGLSNDPKNMSAAESQIDYLQAAGANPVVMGLGPKFPEQNAELRDMATRKGVAFSELAGPFDKEGVHPRNARDTLDNAIRAGNNFYGREGSSLPPGALDSGAGGDTSSPEATGQSVQAAPPRPSATSVPEPPPLTFKDRLTPEERARGITQPPSASEEKAIELDVIHRQQRRQAEFDREQKALEQESQSQTETRKRQREQDMLIEEKRREAGVQTEETEYREVLKSAKSAEDTERTLGNIETALNRFVTGATGTTRAKFYSVVTEIAELGGIGADHARMQTAAAKLLQTEGYTLATALVAMLGNREAAQVLGWTMDNKPSLGNTTAENRIIVEGLRQGAKRVIARRDFYDNYKKEHGNLHGADSAFYKAHPVERYQSEVLPLKRPDTIEELKDKTIYDIRTMKKPEGMEGEEYGRWNEKEKSFDPVPKNKYKY